jgi:hypothetical protein
MPQFRLRSGHAEGAGDPFFPRELVCNEVEFSVSGAAVNPGKAVVFAAAGDADIGPYAQGGQHLRRVCGLHRRQDGNQ